jgi:hypothetical protein
MSFLGKKGSMHQASPVDGVIMLVGVIIGIALIWYGASQGWGFISSICSCPVAVTP